MFTVGLNGHVITLKSQLSHYSFHLKKNGSNIASTHFNLKHHFLITYFTTLTFIIIKNGKKIKYYTWARKKNIHRPIENIAAIISYIPHK